MLINFKIIIQNNVDFVCSDSFVSQYRNVQGFPNVTQHVVSVESVFVSS